MTNWQECKRISELPEVDEALRLFAEGETTEDQAVAIVQAILQAAQQPAGDVVRDAGLYLLQDTRSYIGNCVVWWAKDGNGYTTDADKAHRYTFDEAMRQHRSRDTDLPWLCDEVLPLARVRVDVRDVHKMRSLDDQRAALASSARKVE